MKALRVVVADDEPMALTLLCGMIESQPGLEVVGRCSDGRQALTAIRDHRPDVAFLDIKMPELDGFQVVEACHADVRPAVVFVTAYDHYALEAFRRHALDYLLKPFDEERLRESVEHLRGLLDRERPGLTAERIHALARDLEGVRTPAPLLVRQGARTKLVPVASIDWVEADGNYARLHCGRDVHLSSQSLGELDRLLSRSGFVRIHRSTVVNLARVVEFESRDRRDFLVVLDSGARLKLSRTYRAAVEERLGSRL